ncbi:RNA-binding protein pop5 [Spiromyces aspiralis]|uniref:RNA-binding protein pop5 n=1 Tax=Spiromyces aspiralis TaxID=68401 RepID=A0ACC1HLH3_9FUNG|nr:RNA-binding protein pop5 [Spiromyces aspiralis]
MVRFKNRYLCFEIDYETHNRPTGTARVSLTIPELASIVREHVRENFGDYGLGSILGAFTVKYFSSFTNVGIIRVARDHYHMIWSALTFINYIKGTRCMVRVIHLSGTIKKSQLAAIKHDRSMIHRLTALAAKDPGSGISISKVQVEKMLRDSENSIKSLEP